ncbi:cyclopropane-fatty-acyl-phospholipid synthase family protein [Streptomyces sp. JJ38]|uniref:SAM-dependent methyltransferase n=1 Tax=Streptomyces sp. JJ38 TaxID=2738128 RepID=UPI001C5704D6|nr:class I SAM-dependent methyltransferase [Streptomyces sp. JJ38]MBW1596614.1 class I SAM-dependent methyltransferase [Streptomyces sp. JJ38]
MTFNASLHAHADHPIAAPLSEVNTDRLLRRAVRGRARPRLLDLGCGQGVWLHRALTAFPRARAAGVDIDGRALALARAEAEALGVTDRLTLHETPAAEFRTGEGGDEPYDVVLCVGATHAFGGLLPTLEAARRHLAPGGVAVVGEGFWEREPDAATLDGLGATRDEFGDLPGTVARVTEAGWAPVHGHTSTLEEWDEYEWSWTGSLTRWALDHPEDPHSAEALRRAAAHRDGWLNGYRGTLGFVTLVLRPVPSPAG